MHRGSAIAVNPREPISRRTAAEIRAEQERADRVRAEKAGSTWSDRPGRREDPLVVGRGQRSSTYLTTPDVFNPSYSRPDYSRRNFGRR